MSARRRIPAALAIMLSTILTLVGIEIGFRIWVRLVPPVRWLSIDHYPGNPRGYFRHCGKHVFCPDLDRLPVHACDAPLDPTKSQVLFVGDSFTWGQGVDAVDAYPSLIEFPNTQRRNCAISGSDVFMVRDRLLDLDEKFHPRLVVYGMVLNDFGLDLPRDASFDDVGGAQMIADYQNLRTQNLDAFIASRTRPRPLHWLLSSSEAARQLYRRYVLMRVSQLTIEGYRNAFRGASAERGFAAIREMKSHSQRFLVVLFPLFVNLRHYPFEQVHRRIREELARSHIEVVDLLDVFRGMDESRLIVFPTDQHPNEDAHRIAAQAVKVRLRQLGWLESQ